MKDRKGKYIKSEDKTWYSKYYIMVHKRIIPFLYSFPSFIILLWLLNQGLDKATHKRWYFLSFNKLFSPVDEQLGLSASSPLMRWAGSVQREEEDGRACSDEVTVVHEEE